MNTDESQVVSDIGNWELTVRPGKLMPQKIHEAFARAEQIAESWNDEVNVFEWGFGDFTGGELQYDDVVAQRLGIIPPGEKLLRFTMFPSGGRALAIRPNGELVEFEMQFVVRNRG